MDLGSSSEPEFLPSENVENIVRYVRNGQKAGVSRYAIRLDRIGNSVFNCYEINLYAYARAIDDPEVTAEQIRQEWADKHYPASARMTFLDLGLDGFNAVRKTHFIDGNVIFHGFPISYDFRIPKAGYAFSLFKENIDLHLGQGVWSILAGNRTSGRKAVLAEKDQAVAIAESGLARLMVLPREKGYEKEYEWRERLWKNACVAAKSIRAFCRCVAAYFDDMESGDSSASRLNKAIAEAEKLYAELAQFPIDQPVPKQEFVNGMGHSVFRDGKSLDDAYVRPLNTLTHLLKEEYNAEFSSREKYAPGMADCIICGGLSDDWRCGRYMHASHARILNGYPVRYAGNRVFPNGFIDTELNCPKGKVELILFGDPDCEKRFTISINGERKDCSMNAEGVCTIPCKTSDTLLKLRIEKTPMADYPCFRAVAVKKIK